MSRNTQARNFERKEFGDYTFFTTKYEIEDSLDILERLADVAASSLGDAVGVFKGLESLDDVMEADVDATLIGKALAGLVRNVRNESTKDLLRQIFCATEAVVPMNGKEVRQKVDLNEHFRGQLPAVFKCAAWVLYFNFAPFLPDLGDLQGFREVELIKSLLAGRANSSTDQTSTGESGES